MKLKAFNIKNYRSIKNSGWNHLAYDNITALIGQNESGKTSVLEGLQSFYDGKISDDILRSDMTWPEVSCTFDLEGKSIFDFISQENIPGDLADLLELKKEITITRKWKADRSSSIRVSDIDVIDFYENIKKKKLEFEGQVQSNISNLLQKAELIFKDMLVVEKERFEISRELSEWANKFEVTRKKYQKSKHPEEKMVLEKEIDSFQKIIKNKEEELRIKNEAYEEKKIQTQEISEKVTISKKCNETFEALKVADNELTRISLILNEAQHLFEICSNDKEKRSASQRVEQVRADYSRAKKNFESLSENVEIQKLLASKIFSGISYSQAETEVFNEIEKGKNLVSSEEIGNKLLNFIPNFDFFEDFSSLLPNKIDLEDLLLENTNAEGYKAAKNFLMVAGLKSEFFREKNHRILKQKIENLNGEITINFQDYWHQNVGKNNKIRLHFELEHYDYTVPEKSGKPYLEFWIKDKQERLYPKQRSRGVRWFLSFYLELKATAVQNHIKRVLLIDEPGLSLHARAQEDVLKVFEDIKDQLQIMYCTHSPHLIDVNKLYRILAVQRADQDDENSESVLMDAKSLHSASADTLSPIYSLMGAKLNEQQYINNKNNIILQDTVTYYYLNSMAMITDMKKDTYFIPSSGITGIHSLTNLLTGWRIDFSLLLFGNGEIKKLSEEVKKALFLDDKNKAEKKIKVLEQVKAIEDLFSTIDFKKYILQKREGITESNSDYIMYNNLSRTILASSFINYVQNNSVKFSDFDEETQQNFKNIFEVIKNMLD